MREESVVIRPYTASDYSDVKQNLIDGEMFYESIYSEERLKEKMERDPESILVAEFEGKVVGNVYIVSDWGPLLFGLAVRKEYRKQGFGRKLVEEATNILKSKGFTDVNLLVREERIGLQEMYEKWEFKKSNLYRWMYKDLK